LYSDVGLQGGMWNCGEGPPQDGGPNSAKLGQNLGEKKRHALSSRGSYSGGRETLQSRHTLEGSVSCKTGKEVEGDPFVWGEEDSGGEEWLMGGIGSRIVKIGKETTRSR